MVHLHQSERLRIKLTIAPHETERGISKRFLVFLPLQLTELSCVIHSQD